VGGRPFGALYYNYHSGIHHFTEAEVEFVRGVASSLSLAIENSRLYDAMRRELLRTKILREVAAAASALDLNAVADTVLEVGERLLGARAGAVYRMKMSRKGLRCIALRGYDPSTLPIFDDVPIDESSISGLSILRDQPVFLGHEELPQTTRQRADATNETGTGWVAIPAHAHGRIVGNVTLVFEERRVLDEEDVELFRSIGDQLGAAMETARLFEGERDSARYNAALNAIHSRLTSTLEIDRVLQEVLEGTMSAVGADVGMVFTPIDGHWLVAAISGTDAVALGQVLRNVEIPFSRAVSERGQSNLFSEPRKEPGWEDSVANIVGARQVLDGPLFLGRKESGNIALYRTTPGRDWREADRDFLQKVAVSVSLALQNAQRFESEHHVAETLQTALLALPDSVPGLDFAHAYHSATEEARVGGDFYDLFELRDGRVGITVGDISGHGVESAVLTSLVKDAIRVQATEEDKPPNEVMASANRVLYENSTSELFATVFFGVLDLQTGWFEYCNAGHTTGACLYTRQSSLTQLPPNSPLIGAFPDITFEKSFHQVLPDDVVFLYTDGLTEARRGRELFGEERLFGLLGDLRSRRPADLVREVVDEVNRFTGGELSDDMAILAFQRSEQLPLRRSGE
jgi:serine phosphatase RsbU (regulator of sigma subunit)